MARLNYLLDGREISIQSDDTQLPKKGADEVLSEIGEDVLRGQAWYQDGYSVVPLFNEDEFSALRTGIAGCVEGLVAETGVNVSRFRIDDYHQFVNDEQHFQVVSRSRDLFPKDFGFDTKQIYERLGKTVGFDLTDYNRAENTHLHIIVRINRPGSDDFNPVHKDVYEGYDNQGLIPPFINFWIPICGVNQNSSLPIVPGSHLINENAILRYPAGSVIQGKKYRVSNIVSWNGNNELQRSVVPYGSVLVFSPHLIHGLAKNENPDSTRIALEFRLCKKA